MQVTILIEYIQSISELYHHPSTPPPELWPAVLESGNTRETMPSSTVALLCTAAFGRFTGSSCNPDQEGPVSDKVIEGFQGALLRGNLNQASAYLSQSKSLLVTPLRDASGAKHSAWHLACGALGQPSPALLQFLYDRFTALRLVTPLEDVLNQTNKRGRTCLGVACAAGSQECVRWLLLHGSNAFHADKSGKGALHEAVAAGATNCVHALLEWALEQDQGLNEETCPMSERTSNSSGDSTPGGDQSMASSPAGISRPASPHSTGAGALPSPSGPGVSAVQPRSPASPHARMETAHSGVGRSTLSRLVNMCDANGVTPLHVAAYHGRRDIVGLLLTAGASCFAQCSSDVYDSGMPCNSGWSPLHMAAMRGHYSVAEAILRHHARLPTEERLSAWVPTLATSLKAVTDLRLLTDKRGTNASILARTRSFHDLADLLEPSRPLEGMILGLPGPCGQGVHRAGAASGSAGAPEAPSLLRCPITQEVMAEPVVASDGFTYEQAAIAKWLAAGRFTSPMTNLPLKHRALYPNNAISTAIKDWSEANGLIAPSVSRAAAIEAARKRTNTLRSALMSATIDAEDPFLNGVRTGRR